MECLAGGYDADAAPLTGCDHTADLLEVKDASVGGNGRHEHIVVQNLL